MKKVQLLATTILASSILGGMVSQAAEANTAPDKLDSNAHVKFEAEEGGGEITEPPTSPGNPGEPIKPFPGGTTPSEKAPLMINFAPDFEFGTIKIQSSDIAQPAISEIKTESGSDKAHFVQVTDNRGTHDGWKLTLTTTPLAEASNEKSALAEPTIALTNVSTEGKSEVKATSAMSEIKFGEADQAVMTAETGGEGVWYTLFGNDDSLTENPNGPVTIGENTFEQVNKDVTLKINATDMAKVSAADYTSTLTWNLTGNVPSAPSAMPGK